MNPTRVRRIAQLTLLGAAGCAVIAGAQRRRQRLPTWARHLQDTVARPFRTSRGGAVRAERAEEADEVTLADRVRSALGPTLKDHDAPRIHVMAEGNRILLHGEVADADTLADIDRVVRAVPGVGAVASYVRVGLLAGDSRPSSAEHNLPSRASRVFHEALQHAGISGGPAEIALVEALRRFTDSLPKEVRDHVFAHLPVDVMTLIRHGRSLDELVPIRDAAELSAAVRVASGLKAAEAALATKTTIESLRRLVPESCDDVLNALPVGLRDMWQPTVEA